MTARAPFLVDDPGPGFAFLDYRRGPSYQTLGRDRPPILEGGEVHGFTTVVDLR